MTTRNKNNSIIFLTTLSVYLGLVLVGGTPSVLTYAALTRNFDIQNEIEVKDDLDNKPEDDETESFSKDDFPTLFAQFLNEVKEELNSGKIALPIQTVINQTYKPKAFESAYFTDGKSKTLKIKLNADDTDLSPKVSFSKLQAEQFANFLNLEISSSVVLSEDTLTKQIDENIIASSENDQVFIVTRLPRGSLDVLLAQKDAHTAANKTEKSTSYLKILNVANGDKQYSVG